MIDAVMYGVMLKAKIVKLLNDPPENRSKISKSPLPEKALSSCALSMPGTGILAPTRKTMIINSVNSILRLRSAIFQAFPSVSNMPMLNLLCAAARSHDFFNRRFAELVSTDCQLLFKIAVAEDFDARFIFFDKPFFCEDIRRDLRTIFKNVQC